MTKKLSHIDETGQARMVDVSAKDVTVRRAVAEGFVDLNAETLNLVLTGNAKKGDVLGTARLAGIMAAKRSHELIPLCHPLALDQVALDFEPERKQNRIRVVAGVTASGKTGVEMEALSAVAVACLTIYDMIKAVQRDAVINGIRLLEKSGGQSGAYSATEQNR